MPGLPITTFIGSALSTLRRAPPDDDHTPNLELTRGALTVLEQVHEYGRLYDPGKGLDRVWRSRGGRGHLFERVRGPVPVARLAQEPLLRCGLLEAMVHEAGPALVPGLN